MERFNQRRLRLARASRPRLPTIYEESVVRCMEHEASRIENYGGVPLIIEFQRSDNVYRRRRTIDEQRADEEPTISDGVLNNGSSILRSTDCVNTGGNECHKWTCWQTELARSIFFCVIVPIVGPNCGGYLFPILLLTGLFSSH